jgi:hypothetical protein
MHTSTTISEEIDTLDPKDRSGAASAPKILEADVDGAKLRLTSGYRGLDLPPGMIVSRMEPTSIERGWILAVRFPPDPPTLRESRLWGMKSCSRRTG